MTISALFGQLFDTFTAYDSDESAILAGLVAGDTYKSSTDHKTVRPGLLITIL